ncbi:hypothetical protein KIW84_073964 [Lathyrus oleraceus]|uniref:MULE transposase domain-containing protein n=1 Tax=Pisum sativum TaxID=3888 RepID=A0A9D4ZY08_PEA|nr:hypothetical protein KIW84_073964 [Pisum sativum]
MVNTHKLVNGWGYIEGTYRIWTKILDIDKSIFQIRNNDDAYDFAAYACETEVDGEMFVEHDVTDGFDGINVSLPIDEGTTVVGLLTGSKKNKGEDDEYVSDELDNSDPDVSDDDNGPKFEKFRKDKLNKNFKFKWGMQFNYLDDFREAIRECSVLNGREITFVKNESYRGFDNRSANSRWVAKAVVKKIQTSETVRICDIIQDMIHNYSMGITVARAWKTKSIAKKIIEGDAYKEYANLWRYAAELKRVNFGNTMKINVDRPNPLIQLRFGSFYFYFDGCKKGFINGCRPFVGVGGCHLETKYDGHLLIDVGRDPNDQYFPLTFGVVETETKDNWRWFLQMLMEYVGQDNKYIFISDQQKGLVIAFEEMFERIEHRLCLRYLKYGLKFKVKRFYLICTKKSPDKPRKLRIRECGEDGAIIRFPGVSYRCTKCDKFGHNIQSCKSKKEDPNALKRKKKLKTDADNVNQSGKQKQTLTQIETETDINITHAAMQTETDINTTNPAMQTETDINTTSANKKGKSKVKQEIDINTASANKKGKSKVKQEGKSMRKRSSERIKLKGFQKSIIESGSNSNQPMYLTEDE